MKAVPTHGIDLDVLENTLSFYIRVMDSQVSRNLDQRLDRLEVARGKGKITALFLIDGNPGIRPSVLAELILKDRSATGRILDSFEAHGLIERRDSAKDNRALECFITPKGAALAAKVRAIVVDQSTAFFDRIIPRDEQTVLMGILKRAYHRLREVEA
ncbi:MarR family winged helix-turn-helix transcriptional regulator [Paracoccus laeviglucosivorans]|uniref:Transcriptional regulator, MarR family n=1 Tax=Paracoccus laeviglucosivorans TaxID=1197861 RepID=A0A521EU58_9RHOB|nr:MarR family winged helix-turn-helix transcriptional regulator [Paracoccus laeviglucosivorans]SMO87435.1 transcriptional regulator, MarR family [Paracoccus laeviglucosivorans]